jgi:hypothetical protein
MKILRLACIFAAIAIPYPFLQRELLVPQEQAAVEIPQKSESENSEKVAADLPEKDQARVESDEVAAANSSPAAADSSAAVVASPAVAETSPDGWPANLDLSYLAYYAYSEVPPDTKPADTILAALKDLPIGTSIDEIKLACDAFGLDFTFMKTVARIESGFNPLVRTGSYIGLFQLSHYEFDKFGSGDITSPRDNAVAAAYKFITAAILFELNTHKKPTLYDLYLIHQQGTQGAEEHVSHPERIAWQSMCATDEGRQKGEKWCKRAIWQNTLPDIKKIWKSVDNLTSAAFVSMWQQRIDHFYALYSETVAGNK